MLMSVDTLASPSILESSYAWLLLTIAALCTGGQTQALPALKSQYQLIVDRSGNALQALCA